MSRKQKEPTLNNSLYSIKTVFKMAIVIFVIFIICFLITDHYTKFNEFNENITIKNPGIHILDKYPFIIVIDSNKVGILHENRYYYEIKKE